MLRFYRKALARLSSAPAVALCLLVGAPRASADPPSPQQTKLTADEIVAKLNPDAFLGDRNRSIEKFGDDRAIVQKKPDVTLIINFKFNSVELANPRDQAQFDELGKALTGPVLAPYRWRIVGHTDIRGTPEYNQKLSERRAARIVAMLIEKWNVNQSRLEREGRGLTQLLPDIRGDDAKNRRVQIEFIGE